MVIEFLILLLGLAPAVGEEPVPTQKSTVRLVEIRELRQQDFRNVRPRARSGTMDQSRSPRLTVTIDIAGDLAAGAVKYGFIKISQAEDDQGASLKPREGFGLDKHPHDHFVEVDRASMFFWEAEEPKDKLRIDLQFERSARSAKKLKTLSGTLKLLTVKERREVIVADILNSQGKSLEHDALKSAGLSIKVARVDPKSKGVTLEMTGNHDSLLELALVDSEGKQIEAATMTTLLAGGTVLARALQPWAAVPPDARLKLVVGLGQQTVEVPFSFSDVALP